MALIFVLQHCIGPRHPEYQGSPVARIRLKMTMMTIG